MDVTRQAFVRHLALDKWREIEDMRETLGFDWARAAEEACQFLSRGTYAPLWVRKWQSDVLPATPAGDPGKIFAAIERALAGALRAEEEERRNRGDRPLDEDPEFKAFVDQGVEKLLRQQAGELESFA
jgi:hypothetical protein